MISRPRYRLVVRALVLTILSAAFAAPLARAEEAKPAEPKGDPVLEAMLDRKIPEINFSGVAFNDVVDFLRDVTGANFSVQWNKIEGAGVKRDTPVSTRLRDVKLRTVLKIILDEVGDGKVKVGWTINDNVIVISTVEEPKPNK